MRKVHFFLHSRIAESKYPTVPFQHVDIMKQMPYKNREFDIILCNLVLMDINQIHNAISEFHRVLKPNGIFFFSIVHPAFYLADWELNEEGVIISKKVTRYITPLEKEQNFWNKTMHYHRPISYYFNKLSDIGFRLKFMSEPKVYGEKKIPEIPLYLFAEFVK